MSIDIGDQIGEEIAKHMGHASVVRRGKSVVRKARPAPVPYEHEHVGRTKWVDALGKRLERWGRTHLVLSVERNGLKVHVGMLCEGNTVEHVYNYPPLEVERYGWRFLKRRTVKKGGGK